MLFRLKRDIFSKTAVKTTQNMVFVANMCSKTTWQSQNSYQKHGDPIRKVLVRDYFQQPGASHTLFHE